MSTVRERYGYLPFPLPYILEAEGEDFMFEVIDRLGGRTVRPPKAILTPGRPVYDTIIVRELGVEKGERLTKVLSDTLGLIRVSMPTMRTTQARAAMVRMVHARAAGRTVSAIALSEGVTERAVYKALARAQEEGISPATPIIRDPRKVIPFPKRAR